MQDVFCCRIPISTSLRFCILLELLGDGAMKVVTVGDCYIY